MEFIPSGEEVFWSSSRGSAIKVRRNGAESSTGLHPIGDEIWYQIVDAFPEERLLGFWELLGPWRFEYEPTYDSSIILRTYPKADFSPQAIFELQEKRLYITTNNYLSKTDWMFIKQVEIGTPVPEEILIARASVREAFDFEKNRLKNELTPSEYADFTPTSLEEAGKHLDEVAEALK
ncbi:MAG: hypothetical protein LC687_02255 [Actinobacteria bacterium]|nr:hypothetical protein [Actinomycetota bacterium]